MTTKEDWEIRSQLLREAASRLDRAAEETMAEAARLRMIANLCKGEAAVADQPTT